MFVRCGSPNYNSTDNNSWLMFILKGDSRDRYLYSNTSAILLFNSNFYNFEYHDLIFHKIIWIWLNFVIFANTWFVLLFTERRRLKKEQEKYLIANRLTKICNIDDKLCYLQKKCYKWSDILDFKWHNFGIGIDNL